jgi:CxC2 like cysteine cluster associated with KDZ transposases
MNNINDNNYESRTTNYQQKQTRLAANWKTVLDDIYNSMLNNEATSDNPLCFNCKNIATLKCLDCGPKIFYCDNCFGQFHSKINLFHSSIYLENFKLRLNEISLPQLCDGKCEHSISRILTVHLKGNYKKYLKILICYYFNYLIYLGWFYIQIPTCKGIIESLIENRLFPATPCNPTLAFSFDVFDIYYQLLFEAQVSHLAFCKILEALQYQQCIDKVSIY